MSSESLFLIKDPRSRAELRLSGAASVQERLAFLNNASTRIGSTLDLAQTCREVMDVAVPRLADISGIMVKEWLVAEGESSIRPVDNSSALMRRVATAVAVDNPWEFDTGFPSGQVVTYPPLLPQSQSLITAKTVLIPRLDADTAKETARAFGREIIARLLPGCSFLGAPLLARGKVLGFIALLRQPGGEPFQESDAALAEELAARTAICIDNARLYARERRTALTLQSSLLPKHLHEPAGLEIASRYLPSSDLTTVGGDWFDVISVSEGRTALTVGDVMGHGIHAAATMGQLRTATLTLASLGLGPAELLFQLNRVARHLDPDQMATCVCAIYDQASHTCTIATAGHVPPVFLDPDGRTEVIEVPPGAPLGVDQDHFETREIALPAGSVIALYTDGLVESRGRDIGEGIAALCSALAGPPRSIETMCDTIISIHPPSNERDDIALLLAKVL